MGTKDETTVAAGTAEEKTPLDRPVPSAADVADHQAARALAADANATPPAADRIAALEAQLTQLGSAHDKLGELLTQLATAHNEVAGIVDSHEHELGAIGKFIDSINAKAPAARGDVRVLPTPPRDLAPGESVETELAIDASKPGTQLHRLPTGEEVEINVRQGPAAPAGPPTSRDGSGGGFVQR